MKYHRLNESEISKKNKSFTYYEEHEIDKEFQDKLKNQRTKMKDGQKYVQLNRNDADNNLIEEIQAISPEKQKTVKPNLLDEGPDFKFLNMVLDNFDDKEDIDPKNKENLKVPTSSLNIINPKKKKSNFISEYSLFYKNDYLKSLFNTKYSIFNLSKLVPEDSNNKDGILIKARFIDNYLHDKKTHLRLFERSYNDIINTKCKEIIEFKNLDYEDKVFYFWDPYPFFEIRRAIFRFCSIISHYSEWLVKTSIFESISIFVILLNSTFIIISNPDDKNSLNELSDNYFLFFYTIEASLKIFAFGFCWDDDSYLRDSWNSLDFLIIAIGWLTFILSKLSKSSGLGSISSLRTFRILRPLKTIRGVPGLRAILVTLIQAISSLNDITMVLISFFIVFSIAGVEMWSGLIYKRCMNVNLGYVIDISNHTTMCTTDSNCTLWGGPGNDAICVIGTYIPNTGITSYNNFFNAFLTNFIICTMEGWTDIYHYISQTFRDDILVNQIIKDVYFFILIMVGGYYLFNLYLAVIFSVFQNIEEAKKKKVGEKTKKLIDLLKLQKLRDENDEPIPDEEEKKEVFEKEKFNLIEREIEKLEINYKTLNDMCIYKSLTPEENYNLNKVIQDEANKAKKEVVEYYEDLKTRGISIENINYQNAMQLSFSDKDKNQKEFIDKNNKKNSDLEGIAKFKRKTTVAQRGSQLNIDFNIDLCKDSIEKTLKAFVTENYNSIAANQEKKRRSLTIQNPVQTTNVQKSVVNETLHQSTLMDYNNLSSILGDSQISEDKDDHDMKTEDKDKKSVTNDAPKKKIILFENQVNENEDIKIKNDKDKLENTRQMIVSSILDTQQMVKNKINIELPNQNMTELIKRNNEKIKKKKEELKSKIDTKLLDNKQKHNFRSSFLKILQHLPVKDEAMKKDEINFEEYNNIKDLDVSIHKDEFINDEKLSRIDDSQNSIFREEDEELDNQNIAQLPQDIKNKYLRLLRTDNEYNKKRRSVLAVQEKNNADYFKNLERTAIPAKKGNKYARAQLLHNKSTGKKEEKDQVWKILYKSKSIEKNKYKCPYFEKNLLHTPEEDNAHNVNNLEHLQLREKREKLDKCLRTYRKYVGYVYNLIETDYKIKEDFNLGENKGTVLGTKIKEEPLTFQREESKNIFNVFNRKMLDMHETIYIDYKKFHFEDDELIKIYHHLGSVSEKFVYNIPVKSKTMGMVVRDKKDDDSKKSMSNSFSATTISISLKKENSNSSAMSKSITSKSSIGKGSTGKAAVNNHESAKTIASQKSQLNEQLFRHIDRMNYMKLNEKFIKDEDIINELCNKKSDDLIRPDVLLDNKKQNDRIFNYDMETNTRKFVEWSSAQILQLPDDFNKYQIYNKIIYKLQNFNIVIWNENFFISAFQKLRFFLYYLCTHEMFEFLVTLIVIGNGVVMSLSGNVLTTSQLATVDKINDTFTIFFLVEFCIKVVGLGITAYYTDSMNWLDFVIVVFGVLDYELSNYIDRISDNMDNNHKLQLQKKFNVLNIVRIFRSLRLLKILRKLKTMKKILNGVIDTLGNVLYLLALIGMFVLIYMLLGIALMNQNQNFSSPISSFFTVFDIMSVENWNTVLYTLFYETTISLPYLVSIIFLINWVMLNLFIAILLESFDMKEEDELKFPNGFPELFKNYILEEQKIKEKMKKKKQDQGDDDEDYDDNRDEGFDDSSGSEEDEGDDEVITKNLTGAAAIIKNWEKINKIFCSVDCEKSLYLFPQTNNFRIFCMQLITNKHFDHLILFLIVVSTFRLLIDTFVEGDFSDILFAYSDLFFNIAFLSEMILKIISLGFCMDEGSYLRDSWNQMDLTIVIFSLVDFPSIITVISGNKTSNQLGFLRVLRLLRTLRPLRFISHNAQMKLLVIALFESVESIASVLVILVLMMFIFAVAGNVLFFGEYNTCFYQSTTLTTTYNFKPIPNFIDFIINQSKLNTSFDITNSTFLSIYCDSQSNPNISALVPQCYNNVCKYYAVPPFTFLNIFDSMMTVFVLFNSEGWPDIMNSYRVFDEYLGLYMILCIFIGNMFFLNLFLGVIFSAFTDAYARENEKGITDNVESQKWWDYLSQIIDAKPDFAGFQVPSNTFRKILYILVNGKYFDQFIMLAIIANMLSMAVSFQDSSPEYNDILDLLNYVFTGIFIVECILKLIALFPKAYFYFGWNKFDFFIVCASLVDLLVTNTTSSNKSFLKSFQILRVLRVLRVTRVLRLIKKLKNLEKLLQTIKWSVNGLINIFLLMSLIYSIFGIAGCYIFSTKYWTARTSFSNVSEFFNFDNFYKSMWLIFRSVTGENWPTVMKEFAAVDGSIIVSSIFFFTVIFFCFYVFLNLFLMVSLQQFTDFGNKNENPIEKFAEIVDHFRKAWNKYASSEDDGLRIKINRITNVLIELEGDLSRGYKKRIDDIKKYMLELRLKKDQKNYVYFNDVLFKMFKREFGKLKRKHKVIKKEENRIEKTIQSTINQFWLEQESKGNKVTNSLNTFNPLTSHLYFKISFIFFKLFISNYLSSAKSQQFFIKKKEFNVFDKVDGDNIGSKGDNIWDKDRKGEGRGVIDTVNHQLQENQQLILKDNS